MLPTVESHSQHELGDSALLSDVTLATTTPRRSLEHCLHKLYAPPVTFLRGLGNVFTPHFVGFMALNYLLVKGFTYQSVTYVMLPYFKNLDVTGSSYQRYYNIVMMAFALKPALGVLSDAVPIGGYHKRYYCAVFALIGSLMLVGVNLLPAGAGSAAPATVLFFLTTMAVAALDLLTEGKYAELMAKDTSKRGANIVSFIWACYMLGGLAGAGLEGVLADQEGAAFVIWLVSPWCLLLVLPSIRGWLPEVQQRKRTVLVDDDGMALTSTMSQHKGTIALSIFASIVALILAVVSLLASDWVVLGCLIVLSAALLGGGFAVLPPTIAKANLFMWAKELFYMQINGSLDYFYTAGPSCAPGGPNFSYSYYQSLANTVGNVAGLFGTLLFQRFLIKGSFRRVFVLTTFLKVSASVFDLVIAQRWNVAIGLGDQETYVFGDAIMYNLAQMLDFMPIVILMSRVCPKGIEATIYALLAGISNLGQTSSRSIGYMVADWLQIRTTTPCDFSNLGPLIVIGHMLQPLCILPLIFLLVPRGSMTEPIESLEDRPATPPPADSSEVRPRGAQSSGAAERSASMYASSRTHAEDGQFGVFTSHSSFLPRTSAERLTGADPS